MQMQQQQLIVSQRRRGADQDYNSGHLNESVSMVHNQGSELYVHVIMYTRNANEQACKMNPFTSQHEDNGARLASASLRYRDVAYLDESNAR